MSGDVQLEELLLKHCPSWNAEIRARVHAFHSKMASENEVQNLTRLVSGQDFFWGHVWDVWQLHESGWLVSPALDLGSGGGVPGLLSRVIDAQPWHLAESEVRKAEFLERTASELGFSDLVVHAERAEKVLKTLKVGCVVTRAVGSVSKIWTWIGNCSTWNTLILFKGPAWEGEWAAFLRDYPEAGLSIVEERNYTAQSKEGPRSRRLLLLKRD